MKHIKVELDFIPVEERLPEQDTAVLVMLREVHPWVFDKVKHGKVDGHLRWYMEFNDQFGMQTEKHLISSVFTDDAEITHWAEIPRAGEPVW